METFLKLYVKSHLQLSQYPLRSPTISFHFVWYAYQRKCKHSVDHGVFWFLAEISAAKHMSFFAFLLENHDSKAWNFSFWMKFFVSLAGIQDDFPILCNLIFIFFRLKRILFIFCNTYCLGSQKREYCSQKSFCKNPTPECGWKRTLYERNLHKQIENFCAISTNGCVNGINLEVCFVQFFTKIPCSTFFVASRCPNLCFWVQ